MNKLRVIVVDDEFPARNELRFILDSISQVEIVGEAEDGLQALDLITEKKPNLIFLDIQMPGKNGLEVAREVQQLEIEAIIVFITAYDEYALEAFEVNAIDYLLKPYNEERILEVIKRVKNLYFNQDYKIIEDRLKGLLASIDADRQKDYKVDKLPVYTGRGRIKLLNYDQIIFFSTKNGKVYASTHHFDYQVDLNLRELEDKLEDNDFLRIHRSYLINIHQIKEIIPWFKGKYQVVMNDKSEMKIPVSRSKVKVIKKIFDL